MIASMITALSLQLTQLLVSAPYNIVGATFPITGATVSTPIHVTSPNHGVPQGRVVHGVIAGVTGMTEANGTWQLTPVDPNTFALTSFTPQGIQQNSIGVHAYISGGVVSCAFPDYTILLGRRNVAYASSVASPRIVFVPTNGREWSFEPYGGAGYVVSVPPVQGNVETQAMKLEPQVATEFPTFEVYVTAASNPPSPDFGDFEATQQVVQAMYSVLFDAFGTRARVLREWWPSQREQAGTQTQRGQQWAGLIELQQPVTKVPLQFAPVGTFLDMTVQPLNPGSTDPVTFEVS